MNEQKREKQGVEVEVRNYDPIKGCSFICPEMIQPTFAKLAVIEQSSFDADCFGEGFEAVVDMECDKEGKWWVTYIHCVTVVWTMFNDKPKFSPAEKPFAVEKIVLTEGQKTAGVVKRFWTEKGFGFLKVENCPSDLFFHFSALHDIDLKLELGMRFSLTVGKNPKDGRLLATQLILDSQIKSDSDNVLTEIPSEEIFPTIKKWTIVTRARRNRQPDQKLYSSESDDAVTLH